MAVSVATLCLGMVAASAAQAAPSNVPPQLSGKQLADIEAERKVLFKQMLTHPNDVDLALQYAALSSQVGDLEGAISTLERLMIYAPQVAQLNYQLGILYFRLGAYGQASTDFKAAIVSPDVTPEVKASAEQYISIADKQVVGDYLVGSFVPGVRYQTNANGGASDPHITLNGIPFVLSDTALGDPDYNAYAALSIHGSHDLQDQDDRINLDANLYVSRYQKHQELNTIAGEIQAGPVFSLERYHIKNTTLGLYGILGAVELGGAPYLYTIGAGGVVTAAPDSSLSLTSRFEYRQEYYQDSTDRPTASLLSGPHMRLTEGGQIKANDWLKLYSSGYADRKMAQVGYQSDWEAGISSGATIGFGTGDGKLPPWSLDLQIGLLGRLFDIPDGVNSTTDQRLDKAAYAQATLNVPLSEKVSATVTAAYNKQISNYGLYSFDDASLSLALMTDF